jgi:C4-dicarboxylate-specific signal transduction histidine kinase
VPDGEDGVTNRELARRLDRLEATLRDDFNEIKADLRDGQIRYVSADRHKIELEARDARLSRLESTVTWAIRAGVLAVLGFLSNLAILLVKVKG